MKSRLGYLGTVETDIGITQDKWEGGNGSSTQGHGAMMAIEGVELSRPPRQPSHRTSSPQPTSHRSVLPALQPDSQSELVGKVVFIHPRRDQHVSI